MGWLTILERIEIPSQGSGMRMLFYQMPIWESMLSCYRECPDGFHRGTEKKKLARPQSRSDTQITMAMITLSCTL